MNGSAPIQGILEGPANRTWVLAKTVSRTRGGQEIQYRVSGSISLDDELQDSSEVS